MAYDPNTIIQNAIHTSNHMATTASNVLASAMAPIGSFGKTEKDPTLTISPIPREDLSVGDVPQYAGDRYIRPDKWFGDAPDYDGIHSPSYGAAPTLSAQAPAFEMPNLPAELATFVETPPTLDDVVVPAAPTFPTAFTPPTLTDINVPDLPTTELPEFSAVAPTVDFSAPDNLGTLMEETFSSIGVDMRRVFEAELDTYLAKINPQYHEQMATLESKLASFFEGGTALPPEVEQAIFNRARDKTSGEYLKTRDQIMREGAARGFTIPGGAMYSALAQARQAAADNNARAAIEIAIKQAELEQQNMQFAVTQSANLRSVVLNAAVGIGSHLVQLNAQALEYSKQLLTAMIEVFNARVKLVSTLVEIYRADAQVYETRLKAALAVYDVYRAQLDGLKVQADVDTARVQAFSAQVNAWGAVASLYKAQVDGAMAAAQIEKLKVDIFEAHVRTYAAQVNAKQAEWQGFVAQVQGKTAELGAYETQVRAYGEEVRAYATKIQGYQAEVAAIASKNESAAKVYAASVTGYSAAVQAESAAVQAEAASFDSTIRGYTAKVAAEEAQAKVNLSANEANLRAAIQLYTERTNKTLAESKLNADKLHNHAQIAVAAGGVYGSMASSALAGMNALAQTAEITNL